MVCRVIEQIIMQTVTILSTRKGKRKREQSTILTGFCALPGDLATNHANSDLAYDSGRNDSFGKFEVEVPG